MFVIKCPGCGSVGTLVYIRTEKKVFPVVARKMSNDKYTAGLDMAETVSKSGHTLCNSETCSYVSESTPRNDVVKEIPDVTG